MSIFPNSAFPRSYYCSFRSKVLIIFDTIKRRQASTKSFLLKKLYAVVRELYRIPLFIWTIFHFDCFVFSNASSILTFSMGEKSFPLTELRLLKLLNKRVIFHFHGSDNRPPFLDGYWNYRYNFDNVQLLKKHTKKKKLLVSKIEKYADAIISLPGQAFFNEKPYVLRLAVGVPIVAPPGHPRTESHSISLVHCPSNETVKGTTEITHVVEEIRRKFDRVSFSKFTKIENEKILPILKDADIVVDQLYSDTPLPTFAAEAVMCGRPVVIGGYGVEYWNKIASRFNLPPTCYVTPKNLSATIEELLQKPEKRASISTLCLDYAKRANNFDDVVTRYLAVFTGTFPSSWLVDPKENLGEMFPTGVSIEKSKQTVKKLVERYGVASLCLNDKPWLFKSWV